MKNMKKIITVFAMVGVLGAVGMAYAADLKTPADIAAALTGKSITDINKERAAGKTYGTIAKESGKLDEFKAQTLEQRKSALDQSVKDGKLTTAKADEIYNSIKNNQVTCEGTGNAKIGKKYGAGFGNGQGASYGKGQGMGSGNGSCMGASCGMGLNN